MSDPLQIKRLLRRPQFLAAAKGVSEARGAVVIQKLPRGDGLTHIGVGFTATRKVGGAVIRNRAKRRLRETARALLPELGLPGCDYVFIARMGTAERDWDRLLDDVKSALTRLANPGATAHMPSNRRRSGETAAARPSGQDDRTP
jgi:ribonuclease P protein component